MPKRNRADIPAAAVRTGGTEYNRLAELLAAPEIRYQSDENIVAGYWPALHIAKGCTFRKPEKKHPSAALPATFRKEVRVVTYAHNVT